MRKLILTFLIFAAFCTVSPAHSSVSSFRHITEEDGMSSNQVRAIIQDRLGFVWLGTDQGLDRYDGTQFRSYPFHNEKLGTTVLSLFEDEQCIWAGTDRGLARVSYMDETVSYFDVATDEDVRISSDVTSISKDRDGNLWISTMGQGVFRLNSESEVLHQFHFASCDDRISSVYADRSNQVWALTSWGTPVLYKLNKVTNGFEPLYLQVEGKKVEKGGLVLYEDSAQRFWIGTWDSGLYEVNRVTGKVTVHLDPSSTPKGVFHIHSLLENTPGELLIGSDDGLLLYDIVSRETIFHEESTDKYGLSNRFVYPLMKDREGGIWIGTYYGGVNYMSPFSGQFEGYAGISGDGSPSGKVISRFCEDSDHYIWIASDDGGLSRYGRINDNFWRYLPKSNVHALCVDGDNLWIGTYAEGVKVLNIKTGKIRTYLPVAGDATSVDGTSSYAIFKDADSRIWIATMNGIQYYNREKDNFCRVRSEETHVIDIDQDSQGNLWFSTLGDGLLKYEMGADKWTEYGSDGKEGSLPSDYINCGFLDSRGRMMFGTRNGLCVYEPEGDVFKTLDLDASLKNISGIVEDQQIYWITTTHGLARYDMSGNTQVFTTNDGLQSNQFIANSIYKASDGRIYIGTAKGFNAFEPYRINTNQTVPLVSVTNSGFGPGKEGQVLELKHDDNSITFSFASLSFCAPYKNQYAYMLKDFDKEWNHSGNRTTARYTNLPAGTYTFMVKGTNNDGLWNDVPAELKVVVHPHVLMSTPFKLLYVVLGAMLLIAVFMIFTRRNERKYINQMKDLNSKKEKEVYESKIEFFTMIAHEIRTPVSLIIGPLEKVMKKTGTLPEPVSNDLNIINHNSQRLLYLVNQLLDFRKVEQDAMKMRFLSQPLAPLMREICGRFEPTITYNGARLIVEYPPEDFCPCIDSEALTKLISNLLTNAGKYTKDTVKLSCGIHPTDDTMFNISVYDNGCGISPEEQAKIFRPFYQTAENKPGTGIGLSLVKSIAELHGGIISVRSEPGEYSIFTATLPIYQETGSVVEDTSHGVKQETEDVAFEDILTSDLVEMQSEYKPCVLLVDDNEEMITFLMSTFSDTYQVLSASDGLEALDVLRDHPDVALIVADWMMPRMDGVELCRQIRTSTDLSHIPFILLTAKTDDASKVIGMDCGADAYIEKPFSVQYLEACIKNLVGLRAMLRNKYSSSPLIPLTSVANNNTDSNFLQRMTDIIEDHFSDSNLSVDFLTEHMGISRSSLYNKIKVLTDKTPNELIQIMRLKKAAQLLRENKYRINEICYMVGFNNPSYFSKCFYKQFGMKPGEFAAQSGE